MGRRRRGDERLPIPTHPTTHSGVSGHLGSAPLGEVVDVIVGRFRQAPCWPSRGSFWRLLFTLQLAHGRTVELQPVGVVDEAVEDGVGEGRIADHVVPFIDW